MDWQLLLGLAAVWGHWASGQMVHGGALPSWPPSYEMQDSTFLMACNNTGPFSPSFSAHWGIADFDWSNWKYGPQGWSSAAPMDCEERLLEQARMTKLESNNRTRVFVYRNMVKALPWYSSVRKKLVDPAYAGFFLKFNCNRTTGCHVPTDGSQLYHDHEQTPSGDCGVPCGEYLFDHRNGSMLQRWFIEEFVGGDHGIDSPYIDGFFFDDNFSERTGASEEDTNNLQDCGLGPEQAAAVAAGWRANTAAVGRAVLAKRGFAVPYFASSGRNETDPKTHCRADLLRLCAVNETLGKPLIHTQALMLEFSRVDHRADVGLWHPNGSLPWFDQDLATFLLVRGPYAWIGYLWSGCTDSGYPSGCDPHCQEPGCKPCRFPKARDAAPFPRPAGLTHDYGEPLPGSYCQETSEGSGVFRREWTKASIELDCNSFEAKISPK